MNEGVAIKRISSKSKASYRNSHWDLVDAYTENEKILESLDEEELPKEMQNMSPQEQTEYIEEKSQKRSEIVKQIKELSDQRDKYVAEKRKNNTDNMLDQAIIKAVKKQAIARKFEF
ncbi:MAG: hypothetical protein C0598_01670 [Marinilabiliales bacterium]|nr:MAG: hypothetical protein C0598_01670 [Marinilabiliales bacterium]